MGITLRNVTGSALTYNQMDENFRFLSQSYFYLSGSNTGDASFSGSLTVLGTTIFSGSTTVDTSTGNFIVTDNVLADPIFIVSSTAMGMIGTSSFTGPTSINGNTRITGSVNISGSTIITGSLNVSGGITGSLLGTASNATSASYAATSSYSTTLIASAANIDIGQIRFYNSANTTIASINNLTASLAATASSVTPLNQNVIITGSLIVSGSSTFTNIGLAIFTGSMTTTGSNTLIGNTTLSGSVNISGSTSFVGTHTLSGSNTITGNTILNGNITVSGSSTFSNTTFIVTGSQFYTGSSVYIGDQTITGSLSLTSNGTGTGLFINGQKQFNYISVYHTASILPTQNVSGSFIYSTLVTSNGISIVSGSRITFANTGMYNIQFSAQVFTQTGANVYIWLKKNGTNVADSAGRVGPTANNTYNITAWNYVDTFTSGSYVEIAYQSDQTNTQFQYATATGNIPAIPAIIATVTQVA